MAGRFITFEGGDGCGKSTQIRILSEKLKAAGLEVFELREPGSTTISEKIRELLLDPSNSKMLPRCELLLYEAARAQLVEEVIRPALARGAWVVCDRYADSTYAYQAGGRDLDEDLVIDANALGTGGLWPDLTIVLMLNPEDALERATAEAAPDRMEQEGVAFQQRVTEAYVQLSKKETERVKIVNAAGSIEEVAARIQDALDYAGLEL